MDLEIWGLGGLGRLGGLGGLGRLGGLGGLGRLGGLGVLCGPLSISKVILHAY